MKRMTLPAFLTQSLGLINLEANTGWLGVL